MSYRYGLWKKGKSELQSVNPYSKELCEILKVTNRFIYTWLH